MARMPIDPRLARMIVGGSHFGVLNEILVVVSALAVQDPRERPADKQVQADQKHALFREADSDFLFYLKLWDTLKIARKHRVKINVVILLVSIFELVTFARVEANPCTVGRSGKRLKFIF